MKVLCGVVGRARGKKREKMLWHDGIDGGEAIGVDSHQAATATYRKISPDLRNFVVLFDNQQFGDRADTTRTSLEVQNVGL